MKRRHNIYLDDQLSDRLDTLAAKPGSSKSAITADALRDYPTPQQVFARESARPFAMPHWAVASAPIAFFLSVSVRAGDHE
jgi:predicted transcriptional regulator